MISKIRVKRDGQPHHMFGVIHPIWQLWVVAVSLGFAIVSALACSPTTAPLSPTPDDQQMNELRQSIERYEKMIALDPGDYTSLLERALAYRAVGDKVASQDAFEQMVHLNLPDYYNGVVFLNLGVMEGSVERLKVAESAFTASINNNPPAEKSFILRGVAKRELVQLNFGRRELLLESAQDIRQALEWEPDFQEAKRELEETERLLKAIPGPSSRLRNSSGASSCAEYRQLLFEMGVGIPTGGVLETIKKVQSLASDAESDILAEATSLLRMATEGYIESIEPAVQTTYRTLLRLQMRVYESKHPH